MSRYTLELRYIENNPNIDLFKDVKYYEPLEFNNFKKKFFARFKFRQIGFESVEMFKHFLRQTLNENYDFYEQLYQTKLRCSDIDFMLNKDLKETITREIESNSTGNTVGNSDTDNLLLGVSRKEFILSELPVVFPILLLSISLVIVSFKSLFNIKSISLQRNLVS